jgi:hypothetical protein
MFIWVDGLQGSNMLHNVLLLWDGWKFVNAQFSTNENLMRKR